MKRETRHTVFLTLLAVALVVITYVMAMWVEQQRASIWAEEMRKAGVPAGSVPR
jgi:hypothetical protein